MTPTTRTIHAGVDTHSLTHTLALLDERGRVIETQTFRADPKGYGQLIDMIGDPGCARSLAQKRSGPLPGRFQSVVCMVSPSRDMSR